MQEEKAVWLFILSPCSDFLKIQYENSHGNYTVSFFQLDHDFIVITLPTTSSNTSIILSSKINASLIELDAGPVILLLELGKPIRVTWHSWRKKGQELVATWGYLPNCVNWTDSYSGHTLKSHGKLQKIQLQSLYPKSSISETGKEGRCIGGSKH